MRVWAWWLAHPDWAGDRYQPDCGLVFRAYVPADWITGVENVTGALS